LSLREHRGLTVPAVAEAARLSEQRFRKIERGHGQPTYLTLVRIAKALNVDLAAIVSEGYSSDAPLAQRRPRATWEQLEQAAQTLLEIAREMIAYEANLQRTLPPAPPTAPRRRAQK
jgi:transcriptional regulator with XRE-family HTH domain